MLARRRSGAGSLAAWATCVVAALCLVEGAAAEEPAYRNKVVSLGLARGKGSYVKHTEEAVSVAKGIDLKKDKQEATWKLSDGLSNVEGISIEATYMPGYYLRSKILSKVDMDSGKVLKKRYKVELLKGDMREPEMAQMTFKMLPALSKKLATGVSFEVLKGEDLPHEGWYLREEGGLLYVEENDGTEGFQDAASFNVTAPLFDTCPVKKGRMCGGRGACVDIAEGVGKCKCSHGYKGTACTESTINFVDFKSSDKFDYNGGSGPKSWSTLDKAWKVCEEGKRQSPVAFKESYKVEPLHTNEFVSAHYTAAPYKFIRKGKDIRLELEKAKGAKKQYVNAGGFVYDFSHIEVHTPGEHAFHKRVNKRCAFDENYCAFDAEIHVIHTLAKPQPTEEEMEKWELGESLGLMADPPKEAKKPEGKPKEEGDKDKLAKTPKEKKPKSQKELLAAKKKAINATNQTINNKAIGSAEVAILAIPFKLGNWPNKLLQKIIKYMPEKDQSGKGKGTINLFDYLPQNPTYYRYKGSLTKPPCTEEVLWYVFAEAMDVAPEQIQALYKKNGKNARPVQPFNGRRLASAMTEEARAEAMEALGEAVHGDEL